MAYPMHLNDEIGDCAIVSCAHQIQAWTAHTQLEPLVLHDSIIADFYSSVSGWIPGRPDTDVGCVMKDVYQKWKTKGIAGNKIATAVSVDPNMGDNVRWAITMFGGCTIGASLPQSALDQTDSGAPWTLVNNSPGRFGHAVKIHGYDSDGLLGSSWGRYQKMGWPWFKRYVEEVWIQVNVYWFDSMGISPGGLNFAQLMTDATAVKIA